jgi:hypothetical protein
MPNFYCLYNSKRTDSLDVQARLTSLENACKKLDINFCLVDEATVDFSNLPKPTNQDGLYNCARGSRLLEINMMNKEVKTFYRTFPGNAVFADTSQICVQLEKQGIPMPKTIYKGNNDKTLLKKYVDFLGGFPIIIKTYGGTGGFGVIKVDNYATLNSMADYLVAEKTDFQLKEFIPSNSCERIVVLGNNVLYTISRPLKTDDFRSNAYDNKSYSKKLSDEINQVAIDATHAANLNYAGVDLIISNKDNKPYILEVNCPQNFVILEKVLGESYADKMITWLFDNGKKNGL